MRVIISGASGLLGSHIAAQAPADWEICGWVNSHGASPKIHSEKVELQNEKEIIRAFDQYKPQLFIHTAAISSTAICQQEPTLSEKVNFKASKLLAQLCEEQSTEMVFCSSDLVFDGTKGNYREQDTPNPLSQYAEDKLMAEETIAAIYPRALICRLPLLIGRSVYSQSGYLEQFLRNAIDGKTQSVFFDEYRSPAGVRTVAENIIQLAAKHSGLLHLGGSERMSRSDLAHLLAVAYSLDKSLLQEVSSDSMGGTVMRPKDVSLDSSKAKLFGAKMISLKEEIYGLIQKP